MWSRKVEVIGYMGASTTECSLLRRKALALGDKRKGGCAGVLSWSERVKRLVEWALQVAAQRK